MSFYNPDFAAQRRNRHAQYQNTLQRILRKRQGADTEYGAGSSALAIEKPNTLRNVLNNFSGRGLAFSSGYGNQVQNVETDYASKLAGLASRRNAVQSEADLEQGEATSGYNYDLSDYQSQQAAYEAQKQQELVASQAQQQQMMQQIAQQKQANSGPTRAEFLKAHPVLAGLKGEARDKFLRNHPGIAQGWERAKARG